MILGIDITLSDMFRSRHYGP